MLSIAIIGIVKHYLQPNQLAAHIVVAAKDVCVIYIYIYIYMQNMAGTESETSNNFPP